MPAARVGPGVDQPEEHIGPFAKVALNVDRGPQAVQKGIKIAQISCQQIVKGRRSCSLPQGKVE